MPLHGRFRQIEVFGRGAYRRTIGFLLCPDAGSIRLHGASEAGSSTMSLAVTGKRSLSQFKTGSSTLVDTASLHVGNLGQYRDNQFAHTGSNRTKATDSLTTVLAR